MSWKICPNGHRFFKTSNCPTCPECEAAKKPGEGFLSVFSAPARRALEKNGITNAQQLSKFAEKEVLAFHGMGPASLSILRAALKSEGLSFKKAR